MINLENEDFVSAISKLWDDCSPLIRGNAKQTELATSIMEVFDRLGVPSTVFQDVLHHIGSDTMFHTAYDNLYGIDEYGIEEVGFEDEEDSYYSDHN